MMVLGTAVFCIFWFDRTDTKNEFAVRETFFQNSQQSVFVQIQSEAFPHVFLHKSIRKHNTCFSYKPKSMATRNLTKKFIDLRNAAKASRNLGMRDDFDGESGLLKVSK